MILSPKQFLNRLVEKNIIDLKTAQSYEISSIQKNIPIDEYLLQESNINKDVILQTKAEFLNVSYINIRQTALDPQALSFIQEQIARRYLVVPYKFDSQMDTLYVAAVDPLNVSLIEFLESKTKKRIIFSLADEADIKKAIEQLYSQNLSPEIKQALNDVMPTKSQQEELKTAKEESDQAPIAKIVHTILEFAVKSRASDIHMEPHDTKVRVRYRIDGILEEKLALPRGIHDNLVSRIKILCDMKIDERRVPQDGRFNFHFGANEEVDLRVSTLPTVNGEKIVMRILQKSSGIPALNQLGLRGPQLRDLEEAIQKPNGIILVTGPTGSGKTTTLYSVLTQLNKPSVNIVTLEDPVEYQIPGINQVQTNVQAGLTFAMGLRAFLRQDPNIILVGEIRDPETTQLATQAALTGHLVFSTLHTNDAATAIPRLIDLGAEPFLVSSTLQLSIAQRIARRICPQCKEVYEPPPPVVENIKNILGDFLPKEYKEGKNITLAKGKGCDACNHTGYYGRIAIFETLKNTPGVNKLILQQASAKEIDEQAQKEGLIKMKQDGYLKSLDGLTTIEEVLRIAEA